VSAIVYEFDRRNKLTEDDLEEPEIDPGDQRAIATQKEWVALTPLHLAIVDSTGSATG
jgi:hypothetical protein